MKIKLVFSIVTALILSVVSALAVSNNDLSDSALKDPHISGIIYQYGSCNEQPQQGAYVEVFDRTSSILLFAGYSQSDGSYASFAPPGHAIKVSAVYNNKIGCIFFVMPVTGNQDAHVCINMPGTICQNEE
jgi:hypothetical protein